MLKQFIERQLTLHHYWRLKPMDELTEVYWSQFLRSLSIGIVNIFVPIYLYKIGYDIPTIFWFFVCWFAFRPALDIVTGLIIARVGPKHTMILGVFVQLFHLSLLLSLGEFDWPLWLVAMSGGWAFGLFALSIEVDFSKVKHKEHGGKELGFATIFERTGAVLGPLVGGLIATFFGAHYTIMLGILVLISSLIPVFLSSEPVKTKQKIHFESFNWRPYKRDYASGAMLMLENAVASILWPLFIGIFIFTSNTYALVGFVTAFGTFGALLASYIVGRATDRSQGRNLLRFSAVGAAFVNLLRPLAQSFGFVLGINALNEPLNVGYRLPYYKGLFDRADSLPGNRIVYLCLMSTVNTAARFTFWLVLWVATSFVDPLTVIKFGFIAGAVFSLGVMLERFPSLDKNLSNG